MRDIDTTFGQQLFDVSETQREAKIEPDSVLDDLRWETIAGVRKRSHTLVYGRQAPPTMAEFLPVTKNATRNTVMTSRVPLIATTVKGLRRYNPIGKLLESQLRR